jgi:hypothetical protein
MKTAATTSVAVSTAPACRSRRPEHTPARIAVAGQRGIAVDASRDITATVDEPANAPVAAPVPRAVDVRAKTVLRCRRVAHPCPRRNRKRLTVGRDEQSAPRLDRSPLPVHRPAEVVDRHPIRCAQRKPLRVDPRQAARVRTRPGGVHVTAKVEGVRIARARCRSDDTAAGHRNEKPADPGKKSAARGRIDHRSAEPAVRHLPARPAFAQPQRAGPRAAPMC